MARYQTVHSADPPPAYRGLAVRAGSFIIDAALLLALDVAAALAVLVPASSWLDPADSSRPASSRSSKSCGSGTIELGKRSTAQRPR